MILGPWLLALGERKAYCNQGRITKIGSGFRHLSKRYSVRANAIVQPWLADTGKPTTLVLGGCVLLFLFSMAVEHQVRDLQPAETQPSWCLCCENDGYRWQGQRQSIRVHTNAASPALELGKNKLEIPGHPEAILVYHSISNLLV